MSHANKYSIPPIRLNQHTFPLRIKGFYITQLIWQILSVGIKGCDQPLWDENNWKEHQAGANVCSKHLCEKIAAGRWNSGSQNRSSKEGVTSESQAIFFKKARDSTDSKSKNSWLSGFLPVLFQLTENINLFYISFFISHNYASMFYRAILPRYIPYHKVIC